MLKITQELQTSHYALIIDEYLEIGKLSEEIQKAVKDFQSKDEDFDFIKTATTTCFFVKAKDNLEKLRVAGYNIRKNLDKKVETITLVGSGERLYALAEGLALSNYQFLKYFKDQDKKKYHLNSILLYGEALEDKRVDEFNATIKVVYWARDMVNEPHSFLNATQLSKELEIIANEASIKIEVLKKNQIEKLGMGGLLAVNKGSVQPPTFTIMEYKPEKPINKKPIVLVGKGVVYDTGGLSLKPTASSMDLMKSDMGGAAMMAGTIYAAALQQLNVHLITLIPATDNRPGGDAYTPGDVIKMYDGTTIEVLNTDAEGRMILADGIAYAKQYDPQLIMNAATLTGAALIAVGTRAACLMSNADESINQQLIEAGNNVYERLVQLPLWDDYKEQLKSSIADMKNIGGRTAGTITAGKFLEHFAKAPFIHIDIAGPAFTSSNEDYKGNGGTGTGIRLLIEFFRNMK